MKDVFSPLIKASSLLSSSLDLKEILPEAMQTIKDMMQCEAASIMLLDDEEKNLVFEVALGEKGNEVKEFRLPVGKGIAGKVAACGEPLIIQDAYNDERFYKNFDQKSGFTTKSMICTPLKVQDKIIGVAQAINPTKRDNFNDNDLQLLSLFSNQVALRIESARLHKEILQQKRLEDELRFAQSIQESFLPQEIPYGESFLFHAVYKPARVIGGDFYDAFCLGDKSCFLLGDVCGKGIAAALFMASFISKIRFISQSAEDLSEIFQRANRSLFEGRSTGLFITLIYITIEGRKVSIVNAGHPDPVLYSANKKKAEILKLPKGMPVGIEANENYPYTEITLNEGDALLSFSDGITEAKNQKNEMFSYAPLLRYSAFAKEAQTINEDILHKLGKFTSGTEQSDDITLMTLKIK